MTYLMTETTKKKGCARVQNQSQTLADETVLQCQHRAVDKEYGQFFVV